MVDNQASLPNLPTQPANKPLLVLLPGMGAVATTFMAGVSLARQGIAAPVGSVTQMGRFPGSDTPEPEVQPDGPLIRDVVPFAALQDIRFAGWDLHGEDAATVARRSDVLNADHYAKVADELAAVKPMPAVHDPDVVRRLEAKDICQAVHKKDQLAELRQNIRDAKAAAGADRAVAVFITSTEVQQPLSEIHDDGKKFEEAIENNDPLVTPTQLYAYACIREGVAFGNGTPNRATELPALQMLAQEYGVATAGRDLKTGQTMIKTVLGPALKTRMLGLDGWFSTNILGNRDGEVLDDRDAFKSKESTKSGCLDTILKPEQFGDLYGDVHHKVEINYYRPRGDNKEGWDNIDIFGWLGYPMQLKVNFLCRDSILAAPLVLDIALSLDLAQRAGLRGAQPWMGFFFKAPVASVGKEPLHDLFAQERVLHHMWRRFTVAQ